ncbi:SusC/RagA family TonB-linked outer membrane protein [Mucilaginibacter gracilis]|nr:SusC/RagA family TonB-linked outer membrane protein [Mucilaginibacter gracilis]
MKLTVLLITLACLQVSAKVYSQINISKKNMPLVEALNTIQQQSGYTFFYKAKLVEPIKVDVNLHNATIQQAMTQLLEGKALSFEIIDKTITIKPVEKRDVRKEITASLEPIEVKGRVTDTTGLSLPGASLKSKLTNKSYVTDNQGGFVLNAEVGDEITISFIGYTSQVFIVAKDMPFQNVILHVSSSRLNEVVVSTGYQQLVKENATGSFTYIDNKLINRSVGTDILSRLDGVTSGVIFNKTFNKTNLSSSSNGGDPGISIRGRSTLFANTEPLVVLDNFPYDGDLNNINPNDVESITILKDAAAASIWGVRAGNGVIVITTKKGKLNSGPKVSLNTSITVADKPNLNAVPQMSSKDFIEMEKFWFDNGKYDVYLNFLPFVNQTPAVDILNDEKKGILTASQANSQLQALGKINANDAYDKYFLRNSVNQQYSLSISGGSENNQYYIGGGFDKDISGQIANSFKRYSLTVNNSYNLMHNRLTLGMSLFFTNSNSISNSDPYNIQYPYEQVVDNNGNALAVNRDFRKASKDALSNSGLLDWNYYPFNERLNHGNVTDLLDYRAGLQLNYKIIPKILNVNLNYQYQQGNSENNIIRGTDMYSTRLLINEYAQINPSGLITYPIPLGAISSNSNSKYQSNTARLQFNYKQEFGAKNEFSMIAGSEIKDNNSFQRYSTLYGYNENNATNIPVDYFTYYNYSIGFNNSRIPYGGSQSGTIDRFFSYYANANYTYDRKYTLSASARKDESNLFGVNANNKGVPLYSVGLNYAISKESFYNVPLLPYLNIRLTDGYNGNLSKNLSAYTTATVLANQLSYYNTPIESIVNPPNPNLSWEKVNVINAGIDFGSKNNRISGSFDYYVKKGENLIGTSPVAPQTGVTIFTGNTASMITHGMDFQLNSINLRGEFSWTTNFLLNYVRDKVTKFNLPVGSNSLYVGSNYQNPFVGKPYSAIFAYPSTTLDDKGNPQGYLDGKLSEDYAGILNSTNPAELKYIGTASPTWFGSLRNNFAYQGFDLSMNISFKMGYYFRRGSFTSSNGGYQQADFEKRWQKSGDEKTTIVPALIYPDDGQRDLFFAGSDKLVVKGDHIRLQDIKLGYTFSGKHRHMPFNNLKLYAYVNNLGILWRANKLGIDPDYSGNSIYTVPNPRTYAMGLTADF